MKLIIKTILLFISFAFIINAQTNSPQNLTAQSVKYDVEGYTGVVVSLSWDEVTNSNSDPVPIYTIYRAMGSSTNAEDFESLGAVIWRTNFIDNDVEVGSTYSYFVTATDSDVESDPSNIVEITVSDDVKTTETAAVSGSVKDEITELPLEGVYVVFISENALVVLSSMTDSEGNYSADLVPGDYKIYFRAPQDYFPEFYDNVRHVWEANVLTFEANESYTGINALLAPIAPGPMFNLSGTVLDTEGNPVDAVLHVMNSDQNMHPQRHMHPGRHKNVRTDVDGNFSLAIPEGAEVILYAHPMTNDLMGEFYEDAYSVADAMPITVNEDISGINIVLEENAEGTASISGGVFNGEAEAVDAMIVAIKLGSERFHRNGNLREFTDDAGIYGFHNLTPGDYILFAIPEEGYLPTFYREDGSMTVNWEEADVLTLESNSNFENINFSLMEMPEIPSNGFAEIGGTILDSENQPVVDAYVYIFNDNEELVTYSTSDKEGNYSASGLAPGVYTVECNNYSFSNEENTDVVVSLDEETTVNFTLTPDSPVKVNNSQLGINYQLMQNYPNPFNPSTTISFTILKKDQVKLKVYDILGSEILTLLNKEIAPGEYSIQFNADNLPSGLYIYELSTSNFIQSRKMLLLK